MAEVTIDIAGRSYRIGCGDGEQPHVKALAAMIDAEARKIESGAGTVPEGRLLVMSALLLADRLEDARKEIAALNERLASGVGSGGNGADDVAEAIEAFAARLEDAAAAMAVDPARR